MSIRISRLVEGAAKAVAALTTRLSASRRTACAPSTPDGLRAILAAVPDGPVHIHVAEQVKEVEDCLAWSGARPVAWLLDHAAVDPAGASSTRPI